MDLLGDSLLREARFVQHVGPVRAAVEGNDLHRSTVLAGLAWPEARVAVLHEDTRAEVHLEVGSRQSIERRPVDICKPRQTVRNDDHAEIRIESRHLQAGVEGREDDVRECLLMTRTDWAYYFAEGAAILGLALSALLYLQAIIGAQPPRRGWIGVLLAGATVLGLAVSLEGWNIKRQSQGVAWWRDANAACPNWLGWLSGAAFLLWVGTWLLMAMGPLRPVTATDRLILEARIGGATLIASYAMLFSLLFLLRVARRQARDRRLAKT